MQLGLIISVLMHVAILGGALISIQSRAELRLPETEPVAVGMISPGDVTKVKQGVRTAKLLEAEPRESPKGEHARKEAKRPKTAAAAPPPPPPAAQEEKAKPPAPKAADPPPPVPAAEAQKKAAEEAQRKLEAEQRKQAEAQRLAEQKKQAEEQAKAEALQRAEAQKLAEEKKRIEEEQKQAEARKRAEEEQKRLEEQRRQAELKKKRDEERRLRLARERKERQRKAAEARKRKLEEEKARREAEAAKKRFDADKIAALLNKVPDKGAPPPSAASDQPTKAKGPTLGAAEGRDQIISASERAMIGQVIKSCVIPSWTVLSGGASAQETVVRIRLRFNKDGTLSAPPQITNPQGTPYFRAISESALRAVQQCEPYNLPRSLYEHWKDIIMNFSPKDMF